MQKNKSIVTNDEAYKVLNTLRGLIREQAKMFLHIGYLLKIIRDRELYLAMGEGGYDNFGQFLNNQDIGIRRATAYLYIRIYEYYQEQLKLTEEQILNVPVHRLMRLLPVLKKKEDKDAIGVIERISELTNYDYDQIVKDEKLEVAHPGLWRDKETGLWVLSFKHEQMLRIIDETTGEVIYGLPVKLNN